MRRQRSSSLDRTLGTAPPSKSWHSEGFPEAGAGPATGYPAPVEEEKQEGGWDENSMAPEFVVTIPKELDDLNLQPVTMDRKSDSPHSLSPCQAASLDRAVEVTVSSRQQTDLDTEVLREVPSTQPASPLPPHDPSPRVVLESLWIDKVPRTRSRTRRLQAPVLPPAPQAPTFADYMHTAGRGILRLHAPPKLSRISAPRRQLPPCSALPMPHGHL